MTMPDTPEPTCATCGHDDGHAPMKVGGIVVQHDTYCWLCNNEHSFKPTEALAPAAPSASQSEEAVPGVERQPVAESEEVFHAARSGVPSCDICQRPYHRDDLGGYTIEGALPKEPPVRICVHCASDMRGGTRPGFTADRDPQRGPMLPMHPRASAAVRAEPPREEGGAAGEALEAALSEYNESVQHDGTCGYSFDARTPCSCGKARIADDLVAAARAPGPVAPFAFPEALDASPEEQRETDEFLDTAMGGEA